MHDHPATDPTPFAAAMPTLPDLPAMLKSLVAQIPRGRVTTFGRLADALGSTHAAKWIASWLIAAPARPDCPAHRVVRADGSLGEYRSRPAADQAASLQAEGVSLVDGQVDLNLHLFDEFKTTFPLKSLADWQSKLSEQVSATSPPAIRRLFLDWVRTNKSRADAPALIGGVDVSYATPVRAVAAYVLIDLFTNELVWSLTYEQEVRFPYISGFLSLRELPVLLPLLDQVRAAGRLSPILFVDGHGTLHRRRLGIASHLGIATGLSTIGVGKTLPFGTVDRHQFEPGQTRPVLHQDEVVGMAVRPTPGQKPVYFSPGHRLDLATATELVVRLSHKHRLPAPTYWADRLSRAAARL